MDVNVRKMHMKDVDFVYGLEKTVFGSSLEKKMLYDEILYNDMAHYYVMTYGETRVGYVGLWVTRPNAEIINIAVLPEFQGRGYGKRLMQKAVSICQEQQVELLSLEVRKSKEAAIKFYLGFGFEIKHVRKNYYQDHEDAFLMVKEVTT